MRKMLKFKILLLVLFTWAANSNAQQSDIQLLQATADSLQRAWLRENLEVSEQVISQVFAIRNNMYAQVHAIRTNPVLSAGQQDREVTTVRMAAEVVIRTALGETAYNLYTARIRQRLQQAGQTSAQPLTGTAN